DTDHDKNDDIPHACESAYESWNVAPRAVKPPIPSVSCRESDWRSEPIAITWPYRGFTRDCCRLSAPVAETIESAGTKTGRLASSGRVKRGVPTRLRSRNPYWLRPRA